MRINKTTMTEFWDQAFKNKQEMWGLEPARSTVLTKDFFVEHKIKNVLKQVLLSLDNVKSFQ